MRNMTFVGAIIAMVLLCSSSFAFWGPYALLTENITGTYGVDNDHATSGSYLTYDSVGYVDVYVPNTDDVLQYVRLNLSSTTTARTNILSGDTSITAYRDYAMSNPTLSTATRMYLNTSVGSQQFTYSPNFDWAPSLNLSMSVENIRGGENLYSENDLLNKVNTLQFNFTIFNPSTEKSIFGEDNNITYTIYFNHSAGASSNSSVSILADTVIVDGAGAITDISSAGGSSDIDRIVWEGTLGIGTQASVIFNATAMGGANYVGTSDNLNLGSYGANAVYLNNTDVISEITFTGRFARGPVREGVDLLQGTNWNVKTYLTSMANDSVAAGEHALTYHMDSWRIYNVTPTSGAIDHLYDSNDTMNYDLAAGVQFRTPDWTSTQTDKPYIAPYYDWYVQWNDTNYYMYSGKINFSMTLPTLYEIDTLSDKYTDDIFAPEIIGNRLLTFNVTAYHLGDSDSEADASRIRIYSVIPNNPIGATSFANLTINESTDSYRIYYDSSLLVNTDPAISVSITQPTTTQNGSIVMEINDLSSVALDGGGDVSVNLTRGHSVSLLYDIWPFANETSGSVSGVRNRDYFHFDGNQTLWTKSGTYIVYNSSIVMQASQNSLSAYKQLISTDPSQPQLVNVTIGLTIIGDVDNIKLVDYLPQGMGNYTPVEMIGDQGTEFNRTYLGTMTTTDGFVMDVWEITNATSVDGWDVVEDGYMQFSYLLNLSTAGLYVLPVQIAAFDPGVDNGISITRYGVIDYVVPEKAKSLVIDNNDNLKLSSSIVVGKPASWRKSFLVYNPNSGPTTSQFRTEVFHDAVEVYVSYYDDYGQKVEEGVDLDVVDGKTYAIWSSTINPQESRSYELGVLTPPAVEVDRNVDVLEKLENKHVKIEAEIVIRNFAEESYQDAVLNLNIPRDNIFELTDAFGNPLTYAGDSSSTRVTLPEMSPDSVVTVMVVYKQSYPTIIVTPDRSRYDSGDMANLEILIINGGDKILNPSVETEIYTENMDLLYADIKRLETTLKPLETTEVFSKFLLPINAPTGKYIANIRFGEDFTPITESSINFYVLGQTSDGSSSYKVIILVVLAVVLIYLTYRRVVRVKTDK